MSQAIVETVRVKYPTPLGASHGAFLVELAQTLGGGAGLLFKDWGVHVTLPDGRKVAQDIICYLVPGGAVHFDCLVDGDGAALPAWQDKGPIEADRYVPVSGAPVPVPPVPDPGTPVPVPGTCKAVGTAAEVLDAIHELRLDIEAKHDALRSQLHRLEVASARARKVRGKVSWSGQIDGEVSGVPV